MKGETYICPPSKGEENMQDFNLSITGNGGRIAGNFSTGEVIAHVDFKGPEYFRANVMIGKDIYRVSLDAKDGLRFEVRCDDLEVVGTATMDEKTLLFTTEKTLNFIAHVKVGELESSISGCVGPEGISVYKDGDRIVDMEVDTVRKHVAGTVLGHDVQMEETDNPKEKVRLAITGPDLNLLASVNMDTKTVHVTGNFRGKEIGLTPDDGSNSYAVTFGEDAHTIPIAHPDA